MEEILEIIFSFLAAHYELYLVAVMGVLMTIIYFTLNLVKKPIKKLTGKIKSEQLRHLANKTIILLSFGLATLFWFILHYFVPKYFAFNGVEILLTGAFPVILYAFVDGLSKPKIKDLIDTVKEIADDGKVEKGEVKEIIDDLSKENTAESELDNLLK